MPDSSSALNEAKSLLENRLAELKNEQAQIEKAIANLTGQRRRGPGRPRGSRNRTTTSSAAAPAAGSGKRRRRRKGGTRAEQALKFIKESPGITASEIATKLKIKPNYVYRVMADLQEDGKVVKQGRGYSAV